MAEVDGVVVGILGLASEGIDPALAGEGRAAEFVSAYVEARHQGAGAGSELVDAVELEARRQGFGRLPVVSGSRNREAYGFWTARYGAPIRRDEDYFGTGAERVVWQKTLGRRIITS